MESVPKNGPEKCYFAFCLAPVRGIPPLRANSRSPLQNHLRLSSRSAPVRDLFLLVLLALPPLLTLLLFSEYGEPLTTDLL